MTTIPQKRPLVLLHKCPECTTFAVTALPPAKIQRNVDSLQKRFARFRLNSAPPTISENVTMGSSLDDGSVFEEDEDQNLIDGYQQMQQQVEKMVSVNVEDSSSGTSGHSSLEDSPVARSDSPSRIGAVSADSTKIDGGMTEIRSIAPARLLKTLRHRSVSECEGIATSPIKGILKRPPLHRSLSECADESMLEEVASSECLFPNDAYISESGDDEIDSDQQNQNATVPQSPSFKKTVRFNDLVQQTLFRPNSSILGHKKRQGRKPHQPKRKRSFSNSSNNGDTKGENEIGPLEENAGDVVDRKAARAAAIIQSDQRRQQKHNAILESNSRYSGFQIGRQQIDLLADQENHHRRHASGDSALGDDEEDIDADQSGNKTDPTTEDTAARIHTSDTKDSGMEDGF